MFSFKFPIFNCFSFQIPQQFSFQLFLDKLIPKNSRILNVFFFSKFAIVNCFLFQISEEFLMSAIFPRICPSKFPVVKYFSQFAQPIVLHFEFPKLFFFFYLCNSQIKWLCPQNSRKSNHFSKFPLVHFKLPKYFFFLRLCHNSSTRKISRHLSAFSAVI